MATLPHTVRDATVFLRVARVLMGLLLIGSAAGCAERVYLAKNLPPRYVAPARDNIQEIDLAGLANHSVSSELIGPGDLLEVTIETDYDDGQVIPRPVRVHDNGMGKILHIGAVRLAGLELDEAAQEIANAAVFRRIYTNPLVTVMMKKQAVNKVTVIGAVEKPGEHELPRNNSTLLAAIVAAEGLTDEAAGDVKIRPALSSGGPLGPPPQNQPRTAGRDGVELTSHVEPASHEVPSRNIVLVNLIKASKEGRGGPYLGDGDVVMVMERVPQPVYVSGLVRKPGEIELLPNMDLYMLDAIAKAEGRSMPVADRVIIIRRLPGEEEPIVIKTSIRGAKANSANNVRLLPGDHVSVEETPATVAMRMVTDVFRFGVGSSIPLY